MIVNMYRDKHNNIRFTPWKCDECGRFISNKDIHEETALLEMLTPDSDVSQETWKCLCKHCNRKDDNNGR